MLLDKILDLSRLTEFRKEEYLGRKKDSNSKTKIINFIRPRDLIFVGLKSSLKYGIAMFLTTWAESCSKGIFN